MLKGLLSTLPQNLQPRSVRKYRLQNCLDKFEPILGHPTSKQYAFNASVFDGTIFLQMQSMLLNEMRSNRDLINHNIIEKAVTIGVFSIETYQQSSLLEALLEEFTVLPHIQTRGRSSE